MGYHRFLFLMPSMPTKRPVVPNDWMLKGPLLKKGPVFLSRLPIPVKRRLHLLVMLLVYVSNS